MAGLQLGWATGLGHSWMEDPNEKRKKHLCHCDSNSVCFGQIYEAPSGYVEISFSLAEIKTYS
jgi:hypothetical protein